MCHDKLPPGASQYQMNHLPNKIILTEGSIDEISSNKVWQEFISFNQHPRLNWSPLSPMIESRSERATVVIQENIIHKKCVSALWNMEKYQTYWNYWSNIWSI